MYVLKESVKNVFRNKGRNLLLGLIVFVLIVSSSIGIIINSTSQEIIQDYKASFGSKVYMDVDFDKLMAAQPEQSGNTFAFPKGTPISNEQYLAFAESDYLKSSTITADVGVLLPEGTAIDEDDNNGGGFSSSIGPGSEPVASPVAKIIAYSDLESIEEFKSGVRKLVDGDGTLNKNEVLIGEELATLNNLKVGDVLKVQSPLEADTTLELIISGIFQDGTPAKEELPPGFMSFGGSYTNRRNEIITGLETALDGFDTKSMVVKAEYELNSPDDLEAFSKEVYEKGLPEEYVVQTDQASYQNIVGPVEGLSEVTMSFIVVILGLGTLILLFVTTMTTRERKYEIGVLRALGMKKQKVALMLLGESLVIGVMALILAFGVSSLAAQPVSDYLIANHVQTKTDANQGMMGGGGFVSGSISGGAPSGPGAKKEVEPIEVSLNKEAIVQISVVALALSGISAMVGVIYISKYEPMQILSERN